MRWFPHRHQQWDAIYKTVLASAILSAAAGCSPSDTNDQAPSSPAHSQPASSLRHGTTGISGAGVTTRVDAPADSTEEEYYQACHAARLWMATQPGTGEPLIEPYLAMVQASPSGVAGSWNTRWTDLPPPRQAAVIIATIAAAKDECD